MKSSEISGFLWKIADLLRDDFKRGKYQDVILPLTVLRRLDCVLSPTKDKVLADHAKYKGKIEDLSSRLKHTAQVPFYNTSRFDFKKLLEDAKNLRQNYTTYLNGFSENIRDILEKFKFHEVLNDLQKAKLLYLVTERFADVDLRPDRISNYDMGTVFEELIRKFNEMLDENPGEHFTPREVVELMVKLAIHPDKERLSRTSPICEIYDPACGTGGMLSIARDVIKKMNEKATVALSGQEVNPETWAVCMADMLIKTDPDDPQRPVIYHGSSLSDDGFTDKSFDYMICNPPYGKEWKKDKAAVEKESDRGSAGRFAAGLPKISDGQLLFLQTMISKMKPTNGDYSRIAIIMNGSPMFTGDADSGETKIRRWLFENDWVDAIIALPDQMFYNTGISTYVWILTNRKPAERRGRVQLLDARQEFMKLPKSLGSKRKALSKDNIDRILSQYSSFDNSDTSQVFDTTDFAYRKVKIERPLHLNFCASPERVSRIWDQSAFLSLDKSRPVKELRALDERILRTDEQRKVMDAVSSLDPQKVWRNRNGFVTLLRTALRGSGAPTTAALIKAIWQALGERDETADACLDAKGRPEPDVDLRDYEYVPLKEDIKEYFRREVEQFASDAWIDEDFRDQRDGGIGMVGYELNFNRYFYTYTPPRHLAEIDSDLNEANKNVTILFKELMD